MAMGTRVSMLAPPISWMIASSALSRRLREPGSSSCTTEVSSVMRSPAALSVWPPAQAARIWRYLFCTASCMSRLLSRPDGWDGAAVTAPGLANGSTGSCARAALPRHRRMMAAAVPEHEGRRGWGIRTRMEIIRFLQGLRPTTPYKALAPLHEEQSCPGGAPDGWRSVSLQPFSRYNVQTQSRPSRVQERSADDNLLLD